MKEQKKPLHYLRDLLDRARYRDGTIQPGVALVWRDEVTGRLETLTVSNYPEVGDGLCRLESRLQSGAHSPDSPVELAVPGESAPPWVAEVLATARDSLARHR